MDEFTLDDCKWLFYGASSASAHDVSSIFHQGDTHSGADDFSSIFHQGDTHSGAEVDTHPSADDFSSIFHQVDTHPSADDVSSKFHQVDTHPSAPCLGFGEWMQAEEAVDLTFMNLPLFRICDDLFEDELQLQLSSTVESAFSSPPPSTSHAATSCNITSDSQEVASSSASITDANQLDLKNIIVKKPILDKAVESLGGGNEGAQRLWALIQVWLKNRNISTGLESPFFSNIATNQAAAVAPPTSFEKMMSHESNAHVENAALYDIVMGPAMDALPNCARIVAPGGSSVVSGTTAAVTAVAACESPTARSRGRSSPTAAELRAARKRRMTCKRRYLSHHQARIASSLSLQATKACHDSDQPDAYSFSNKSKGLELEIGLRSFLPQRVGVSDLGGLGRIVLPKLNLPPPPTLSRIFFEIPSA